MYNVPVLHKNWRNNSSVQGWICSVSGENEHGNYINKSNHFYSMSNILWLLAKYKLTLQVRLHSDVDYHSLQKVIIYEYMKRVYHSTVFLHFLLEKTSTVRFQLWENKFPSG